MSNETLQDFDALMNASMDDLDDLPPVGVPPSGHYTLSVTASREKSESGSEYIKFTYAVVDINELKDPNEAGQVAKDQKFTQMFSPFKKDGSVNEWGVGFLKEAVAPFAAHFGTKGIGETLQTINQVVVAASLTRRPDRKDPDRMNFTLKDVVIL